MFRAPVLLIASTQKTNVIVDIRNKIKIGVTLILAIIALEHWLMNNDDCSHCAPF